jgi:cytochrome c peroxidase
VLPNGPGGFCPGIKVKQNGENVGFALYDAFANPANENAAFERRRESIARGQAIFNTRTFNIVDVPGLNDGQNPSAGTCSTCHSNQNVGNDVALDPKQLGIMDNTSQVLPPTPDFPLFAFYCPEGLLKFFKNPVTSPNCPGSPAACDEFDTTDPGLGLITGKCADLGKMKVPTLRGLASLAPYFHGGNAATLPDVVNFYDKRFAIKLSKQDKQDLVNFLNTL